MARTDEDRTAWRLKMQEHARRIRELPEDARAQLASKMLVTTIDGHTLSVWNNCYLQYQTPTPLTIVGGFQQWRRNGRHVRKGQTAAGYILVPMGKGKQEPMQEPQEGEKQSGMNFKHVPVWDVSQTDEGANAPTSDEGLTEKAGQDHAQVVGDHYEKGNA